MRNYVLATITALFVLAVGLACFKPHAPSTFTCLTPFGTAQLISGDERVNVGGSYIILNMEAQTAIIPRALCVETIDK